MREKERENELEKKRDKEKENKYMENERERKKKRENEYMEKKRERVNIWIRKGERWKDEENKKHRTKERKKRGKLRSFIPPSPITLTLKKGIVYLIDREREEKR